ncbi:hypothetical protein AFLA_009436 [Aspergillus flavus NRRL3357]|nr:hypothetical protein AFLA_009436 [Aspergillus flavus NRRL3357]
MGASTAADSSLSVLFRVPPCGHRKDPYIPPLLIDGNLLENPHWQARIIQLHYEYLSRADFEIHILRWPVFVTFFF